MPTPARDILPQRDFDEEDCASPGLSEKRAIVSRQKKLPRCLFYTTSLPANTFKKRKSKEQKKTFLLHTTGSQRWRRGARAEAVNKMNLQEREMTQCRDLIWETGSFQLPSDLLEGEPVPRLALGVGRRREEKDYNFLSHSLSVPPALVRAPALEGSGSSPRSFPVPRVKIIQARRRQKGEGGREISQFPLFLSSSSASKIFFYSLTVSPPSRSLLASCPAVISDNFPKEPGGGFANHRTLSDGGEKSYQKRGSSSTIRKQTSFKSYALKNYRVSLSFPWRIPFLGGGESLKLSFPPPPPFSGRVMMVMA